MDILCSAVECHFQLYVAVYFRWYDHHELLTPSGGGQLAITALTYFNFMYLLFYLNFEIFHIFVGYQNM